MAKWYIPKRNEQEKDEEKDKFAQKVSDPFRTENKAQEMAESIIKTPHKSVSEGKTETNSPTNNSQPVDNTAKMQENAPTIDKPTNKQGKTSGKWYVTEGHNTNGFKTRTWESGEARAYRLGDQEEEQDEQTASQVDDAGQQVRDKQKATSNSMSNYMDLDEDLFNQYKEMKAKQNPQNETISEEDKMRAMGEDPEAEEQISNLSDKEKELLDKYNSATIDKKNQNSFLAQRQAEAAGVELSDINTKEDYKSEFLKETQIDEEQFEALAKQRAIDSYKQQRREMQQDTAETIANQKTSKNIFSLENAATVLANDMGGAAAVAGITKEKMSNPTGEISPDLYTANLVDYARDYRGELSSEINKRHGGVAAFAYQAGMSSVDSGLSMLLKDTGLILQSTTAAADTFRESRERGLDTNHALATAAVAGAIEYATEKIGLKALLNIKDRTGLANRIPILVAKGLVQEGNEEVIADIGNATADALINADMSAINQQIKDTEERIEAYNYYNGIEMTEKEVKKQATKDVIKDFSRQTAEDWAAGITGSILHLPVAHGMNQINLNMRAGDLFETVRPSEIAESIDTDRSSYKSDKDQKIALDTKELAEKLAEKEEKGEKITQKEKRQLQEMVDATQEAAYLKDKPESLYEKIAQYIEKKGAKQTDQGDNVEQSTDNVAQNTDNAPQENRRVAPVQSDITQEETVTRMSQAKTAEELGAVYNEAKNSVHEDVRKMADNLYDTYAGKLQSEGVSPEALRQGRISEQEAYEAGREGKDIGKLNARQTEAYSRGVVDRQREEYALKAGDKHATTNDGQEIEVSKIVDTKEGKVETADGQILPMSGIHFSNAGTQRLYNEATEFRSPQAAQIFIEAYPAGTPVNSYSKYAKRFYNAGQLGSQSFEDVLKANEIVIKNGMKEEAARSLYEAGRKQEQGSRREESKPQKVRKAKGRVIDERANKDDKAISKIAKGVADKLGVDIRLTDQMESQINGQFSQSAGEVVLNTNNSKVWQTLIHECMGEFTEAWNDTGMAEIQDEILNWWLSGPEGAERLDNVIKKYQSAYEEKEGSKSYREAANELVNDALAGLFSTPEGIEEFTKWANSNVSNNVQTNTVLERIANYIKELIDTLKEYIARHTELSDASRSMLQMEADRAAGLRARVLEAADQARASYELAEKQGETSDSKKNSLEISNTGITETSTSAERYNILKDLTIDAVDISDFPEDSLTLEGTSSERKRYIKRLAQTLGILNVPKTNRDIHIRFRMSNANFDKSINYQVGINGEEGRKNLAIISHYFDDITQNARLIEVHPDLKRGQKRGDPDLKRVYVLISVVKKGEGFLPVKLEIKEFEKRENGLYVYVTYPSIEKADTLSLMEAQSDVQDTRGSALSKYRLSPILREVKNSKETAYDNLAKYIPDEFKNDKPTNPGDDRVANSLNIDTEGKELSTGQQEFFADESPLLLDENGALKRYYHGTARIDRVGTVFDPARATSGPMAFFTDDKSIAENYAKDKSDTSISRDERYDSYYTQFRLNIDGKEYSVPEAWNRLPASKRIEIKKKAEHVTFDDDYEEIIYDPNNKNGLGNFDAYILREHKGNYLEALVDSWLESGDLFGQEERFPEVLKLAGLDNVQYLNPDERNEGVYEVYLHMANPFNTSDISKEDINAIREAAKKAEYDAGQVSADMWDKNNQTPEHWLERFEDDIKEGSSHSWTSIPDWVTEALKQQGYDGIIDKGGKYHEVEHQVAIPFSSEQIKSIDNDNPTENPDIRFSLNMPVEAAGNLIAVHNLNSRKLMGSLELGGFPMPSIAITKADMGFDKFGDISVLFKKNTIDPMNNRYNKVYAGDAYTPIFPRVEYKIDSDKVWDIEKKVKTILGNDFEAIGYSSIDPDNVSDALNRWNGNYDEAFDNNYTLKHAFLKDSGNKVDLKYTEAPIYPKLENDEMVVLNDRFLKKEYLEEISHDYEYGRKHPDELKQIRDVINNVVALKNQEMIDGLMKDYRETGKKRYKIMADDLINFFDENSFDSFDLQQFASALLRYRENGKKRVIDQHGSRDEIDQQMKGKEEDYKKWLSNLFDGVIEKKGIRNNKDPFTPQGNRRKWDSLHDDYNLTNIVNNMRKEPETGQSFGGFSFFGSVNREFDSIEDIKSETDRLQMMEEALYTEAEKKIEEDLYNLANRIKPSGSWDTYSAVSDIAEAVAKYKTKSGIKRFLSQWYNITDANIEEIMSLVDRAKSLPTGYFEAKPQRAVSFDEIARVVLPDNVEQDLIDQLNKKNIPYTTYKAGDKESRKEAVNSVEDIRFSLSGIDTDILSGPIKYSIGDDILDDLFNGTIEEVTFADEDPGSTESYRRNIDTTVANLSRMLEAANAPLRGHSVDYQRIGKIADRIKDEYNSHISKQVLTNNLTTVFDYLQNNENIDYDDITRLLTEIAAPVLEKTGVEVPEAYQHFKQYVRSMPIKLSEQQKQELAYTYGSYASARKQNFGRINFSDEGTPIDRIWPELVRESAGLLDETANAGDMAHMLIDAVENCDHGYSELEMERGQNMAEASIDLAIDIMEEYYKAEADAIRSEAVNGVLESGMAGAAARESIDKARAQMKRQQEEFRKKTKEEYDARIKELEREAGQVDYYKAMADYNETVRKVEGQKSKAEIHRLMVELANTRRDLALKTKALQKDSVMNYKQRQDAAKTRKEITRIGNDLMKRILEPTSKKHVPTDLQKPLAEFLSGIDFVSHRSKEDSKNTKTWRERMQTLSIYLSQLEDGRIEDELGLQAVLDPDLNADIRDFIKDTEGYARVSQLDAKHLKDLLGILKRLQVAINKSDTLYLNNTYKKVSDLAVATRNELEEKKTRRPMFTMQGIAYNTANISMLDPTSYFEEMGEAPKSVFKTFRNGFDQRAWHLKEAQEYMEKVLEGISQKDLAQWSRDKYTFNVSDGEITLTITQIMSLYELMKRDQAREHIMRGGIKADVREEGRWLKKSYTQNKPVHITPENFLTIIGKLTDEQKAVADAMQRFMANQCAEWGNHTTEQMYGYKKFTEKNYYPIKTDKNTIAANDKNTGDNGSLYHLRNLGMTKDLTPHAKNAIVLSDIFNVFSDHVADMATYDGMVMPLSDAMRWFNFKVTSEIMDEAAEFGSISDMWSIQEEIERVLGTPGKAYFTNLIKDINGMTPKAYDTQLADKLISNYKAAAVGANVRVIVQQPTAILRAANEMSPKYLARVLNPVTIAQSGKLAQKAKDNSAIAWWKGQGYFETSIGQSMRQMITGEATMGETIREYANKGAQVADDLTWGLIWRATELEIKDKRPELEYGSKEFNEAVTERFNDIVDRTQVVDTVLHRTQLMRSKSDINKLEMAFMAEPMKSYNMLHRAWKSGDKKKLTRAATTFVLTNILTAAAAAIVDAFRKDDDETPWLDRYLTALKENIIDNLNPLNMFPYLKDVSSAMQGFENGRMDIEGINNLVQSLGQLEKFVKGDSKKTPYGMLKSLSKGISQLSGIPAYSLIRTFESIYNTFFDNLQTTVTSDYSYAYTAIDKNGDIEGEIQKLIDKGKNPDSIAAALTKHYKNEYIALPEEERQEMKEKLLKAYEAAGKDYEKNIDKWVTNAEKTEEPTSKNNSQDDSQNEEVAPVQEEYTSDYAGVYDAIDKGGNIQAEVQSMLDSGKQKSGVKSAITRHYKDDYLAASGSEKANMKNTLIKAYTAAGYTREEAISTIEGW